MSGVTRDEASTYCRWAGARLPTMAEWLHDARALCRRFPWGDQPDIRKSNCLWHESGRAIRPPAVFPDDVVHGIYDLHGNVAEWTEEGTALGAPYCSDALGAPYSSTTADSNTGIRCTVTPSG